jgi:hypothetical protein
VEPLPVTVVSGLRTLSDAAQAVRSQLRITMFIHQHNHLLLLCQDPANGREALIEAALDEAEGADMLMVKPGRLHSY